ncbi:MAG: tyrosine-type recombinase/integrase [Sphaerochaeta sp.]|jgi:integrase|nr:tyrosine-type recombinase/integrase [Sphaerochaeta sp.]
MRTLDDMCLATRHTSGLLDEKVVMALYPLKDDENPQAWKLRNCSLRQFAYYLHSLGKPAFVAPKCTSKQGPKQETAFDSDLGPWMQSLVEYKRAMGYKYLSNRKLLKQFDAFLINKGYTGIELTRQMVMAWEIRPKGESEQTRANKTVAVHVLGQFMGTNGGKAYVSPYSIAPEKPIPYVFSTAALESFFQTLDTYPFARHWMRLVYPVYYRLLYATGLRESEACSIERENLDFEAKRILILNAKGNKDRYVYFADDVATMLFRYDQKMDGFFPCRHWLFVGALSPQDMLIPGCVRAVFSAVWKSSGMKAPQGLNNSPCTHAFRHTYVIGILTQWQNEGKDVDNLIPYLSKQLGHKSIRETYLYCTRLDTKFSEITALDTSLSGIIPEVHHV